MIAKPTQGLWELKGQLILARNRTITVASVDSGWQEPRFMEPLPTRLANGRLLASAPQLLAAMEHAVRILDRIAVSGVSLPLDVAIKDPRIEYHMILDQAKGE